MPTFNFDLNLSTLAAGAAQVVVVLAAALIFLSVARHAIPKFIEARIPKIREESVEQLALRSTTLSRVVAQVVSVVVWVVTGLMVMRALGIDISPVLATVGIPALALGFAAQSILRDYLHGFFIVMEDWYRVGEVVNTSGIGGLVEDMSLRRTVLRDLDGTLHFVPNGKIELASNLTRDWARVNLNISVAYKENLDHVFRVITEVCDGLADDPIWSQDLISTPHVERVDNLGNHGVEVKILGETRPIRQWAVTGELRKRLKDRFDQEGIEVPWPHTKVYFGNSLDGQDIALPRRQASHRGDAH